MIDYQIRAGDRLPALEAQLLADLSPVDLTGAAVELRYRPAAGGATVARTAEVTDAATGMVRYAWIAGETDTAVVWEYLWRVIFSDGRKASFPSGGVLPRAAVVAGI